MKKQRSRDMEKIEIRAVELIRRIRDEHARILAGKSDAEVMEVFRKAGEAAREAARRLAASREAAP